MMKGKLYITIIFILLLNSPIFAQEWEWKWEVLPDMPTERFGHCSVVYKDKVWMIGGRDQFGDTLTSIDCYDLKTRTWESNVSHLLHSRFNATAVVFHDTIFVIGGLNGRKILNSVEYYDTTTNNWKEFVSLPSPRHGLDAVVYDKKMYVIGGKSHRGSLSPPLDVVVYYDSTSGTWLEDSTWILNKPRIFMQSIVLDDFVYTIGGLLIDLKLDVVERYGKNTGVELQSSLPGPRFSFSAVTLGDSIYVIGGYKKINLQEAHHSIEFYDPIMDQWFTLPVSLSESRAALTAVSYNDSIYVFGGVNANLQVSRSAQLLKREPLPTAIHENQTDQQPVSHQLINNYPNPFNSVTTITFQIGREESQLQLVIFNLMGEPIRTFYLNSLYPGTHHIQWDGRDEHGRVVESGIYLARSSSDNMHGAILKLSFIK